MSTKPTLFTRFSLPRNFVNCQYQSLCFAKLVRIDRLFKAGPWQLAESAEEAQKDSRSRTLKRASSQSERFCTALPKQVSESRNVSAGEVAHSPGYNPNPIARISGLLFSSRVQAAEGNLKGDAMSFGLYA